MSRVGKYPIVLPQGVGCVFDSQELHIKGPKGEGRMAIPVSVIPEIKDGKIFFAPDLNRPESRRLWGTTRSLAQNMVKGVSEGFTIHLEIEGVGYRASVQGNTLKLQLGYSHDIDYPIPEGVHIKCDKPTQIAVSGANRQQLGQVVANIQSYRKLEPYKGKGIRRVGQFVFRKEGKKK
jgi:large subunit ribosomal protein L6